MGKMATVGATGRLPVAAAGDLPVAPTRWDRSAHRFPVRVYYEDTDAGGIVYYANYLKFAERARTEWLREVAGDAATAPKPGGLLFVVRRCEVDYLLPARLDDVIAVETRVIGHAGATIDLEQIVLRGPVPLVKMRVTLACLNAAGRPVRLPAALRGALETTSHS